MRKFYNPFEYFTSAQLLLAGVAINIMGALLGYAFGMRFDGVLDIHVAEQTLAMAFVEMLINTATLSVLLYLAAYFVNNKTRFIDILIASLVAKAPLYLLTFFNTGNLLTKATAQFKPPFNPENFDFSGSDLIVLIVFALLGLLFLVWFIALLFNGFIVASNSKGAKGVLLFIVALLAAEILTKIIFSKI